MKITNFIKIPFKLLILTTFSLGPYSLEANDINQLKSKISNLSLEYLQKNNKDEYILGSGDILRISISPILEEKTADYIIDGEGTITTYALGKIYVAGLTSEELRILLNEKYRQYVKEPDTQIEMIFYRPISVYVEGEVNEPGLHNLSGQSFKKITNLTGDIIKDTIIPDEEKLDAYVTPTLFNAIVKAGGINLYSDLESIEIIRKDTITNGSGFKKTEINFLEFIEEGNQRLNLRIYDGDHIKIKKASKPVIETLSKAVLSNLNPKFLKVSVTGRVANPGAITLSKLSTFNDAIYIAGGVKPFKGKMRFVRLNYDGTIDKRKFSYSPNASQGSFENPYLKTGDIIYVDKGLIGNTSEVLSELTAPFLSIFTITELLNN